MSVFSVAPPGLVRLPAKPAAHAVGHLRPLFRSSRAGAAQFITHPLPITFIATALDASVVQLQEQNPASLLHRGGDRKS